MIDSVLNQFGLNTEYCVVQQFDSGLINKTWKVSTKDKNYILQKINDRVFKRPEDIDKNLVNLKNFLNSHHPDYLFLAPLTATDGRSLIKNSEGYFRLFDFVNGSHTINYVKTCDEAYEAARQFGKFSRLLSDFNADELAYTLPDFHNLTLRYEQFIEACAHASEERLDKAQAEIDFIRANDGIVNTYNNIRANGSIPHRVVHHDTKISNVLFDQHEKGLCVIDLDTVMPGFYISDVGDMMRTYLSPANEEETDLSKIHIRKDFFKSIYMGYLSEMGPVLSEAEKQLFIYSGEFIIYMQAIRFLSDYLNNDIYYGARYPNHNLNRAMNQITLLKEYVKERKNLRLIISESVSEILP